MEERKIVDGDHQWNPSRWRDHAARCVHHIDRAGPATEARPTQAMPSLVQSPARQREVANVDTGPKAIWCRFRVVGRDPDDLPLADSRYGVESTHGRGRRPARDAMPALFDNGSHTSCHGPESVMTRYDLLSMGTPFEHMRFFLTGGTGFLGGAVQAALGRRGVSSILAPSSHEVDFRDPVATDAAIAEAAPDVIIHMAARVGGIGANMAAPADLYLENLLLGTNVIEAARRAEVAKTVVVGTICSYPKHTPVPFRESSLWSGYPEETNAPYGIAKLAHLVHLQANRAQYGQRGAYLMPTNLYGPGDKFHPDVSHVIPALIRKCVIARETGADEIEVWGTGGASREFLFVDDAAEGIVRAAEHWDGRDPVNLGANRELLVKELVEIVAELTNFEGQIRWDESKPDGQPRRCVDASLAEEYFGFRATTDFRDGLRSTIEWYEANRELSESRLS